MTTTIYTKKYLRKTQLEKLTDFVSERGVRYTLARNGLINVAALFCFHIDLTNDEIAELRGISSVKLEIILIQQKKLMRFRNKKRIL